MSTPEVPLECLTPIQTTTTLHRYTLLLTWVIQIFSERWLRPHSFPSQTHLSRGLAVLPPCLKISGHLLFFKRGQTPVLACHSKLPTIWPQPSFLESCPIRFYSISAFLPSYTIYNTEQKYFAPCGDKIVSLWNYFDSSAGESLIST